MNEKFKPGDKIHFAIEKEGWAIRDPLLGEERIPSYTEKDLLKLKILPKGSPLFFTDPQISSYVEYLALKQKNENVFSITDYSKLSLDALFDTLANNWGFKKSDIEVTFQNWIDKTSKDTSSAREKALAEYAKKNFNVAGKLFYELGINAIDKYELADKEFEKSKQKRKESIERALKDFKLSAESYYEVNNYDSSIISYKEALKFFSLSEKWGEFSSAVNRIAICYYNLSLKSCDSSKFNRLDSEYVYFDKGLNISNENKLTDWKRRFQGNIISISIAKQVYSEMPNKNDEVTKSINSLETLIISNDNGFSNEDRAIFLNNIGNCYNLLYQFTPNLQLARTFLDSASFKYESAIIDSNLIKNYPLVWSYITNNFVLNSIYLGLDEFQIPTFFQMIATRILNDSIKIEIDNAYISYLNNLYLRLTEAEKTVFKEDDKFGLVTIMNNMVYIRLQLLLYSDKYAEENFILTTDSLISVANDLANENDFFEEVMFLTGNKSVLEIIKLVLDKTNSTDELAYLNNSIENLLSQKKPLRLFQTYLQRILFLNYILLSTFSNENTQKSDLLSKADDLIDNIIDSYKSLNYMREWDEAIQLQKIIHNSD